MLPLPPINPSSTPFVSSESHSNSTDSNQEHLKSEAVTSHFPVGLLPSTIETKEKEDNPSLDICNETLEGFDTTFQNHLIVFIQTLGMEKEESFEHLEKLKDQGFSAKFIQQTFSYGMQRYAKTYLVITQMEHHLASLKVKIESQNQKGMDVKKLEAEAEELEKVIHTQKQWALHLLVKCSKTLLCSEVDKLDLSFSEYLWKNESTYYRGDGGSLIDLYVKLLEKSRPILFPSSKEEPSEVFSSGIIKPDRFPSLIQAACEYKNEFQTGAKYMLLESDNLEDLVNQIEEKLSKVDENEAIFFDITSLFVTISIDQQADLLNILKRLLSDDPTLLTNVPEEQIKLQQLLSRNKTVLGGVVMLSELDVGLGSYILLSKDSMAKGDIEGMICNYQGNIGAYPEPILLEDGIIRQLNWKPIEKVSSNETQDNAHIISHELNRNEIKQLPSQISDLLKTSATSDASIVQKHYKEVFRLLFGELEKNAPLFLNQENFTISEIYSLQIYCDSLNQLKTCLNQIESSLSFEEALQAADKGMEEILNLANFCSFEEGLNIPEFFTEWIPLDSQISHASYLFSSGMAAIDHVFDILLRPELNEMKKVMFLNASYYELTKDPGFKDYLKHRCSIDLVNASTAIQSASEQDIIFLDLYPNFATLPEVRKNPVEEIIEEGLKGKTADKPLIILLDVSTGTLKDTKTPPEIETILTKYQSQIEKGNLQILIVNSLAKYAMNGFDKYTGGLIQCFCSKDASIFLLEELKFASKRDKLSRPAKNLFQLFLTKELVTLTNAYWESCIKNTNDVYQAVQSLSIEENSLIQIAIRDPEIPMIGLHVGNFLKRLEGEQDSASIGQSDHKGKEVDYDLEGKGNASETALVSLVHLMQYHIYSLAKLRNLPLLIRPSFGFPHSALIECHTALRLTLGALEDRHNIGGYSELLLTLEENLNSYLNTGSKIDKDKFFEFLNDEDCLDFLNQNHVKMVKEFLTTSGSFKEFIEIVLKEHNAHKK